MPTNKVFFKISGINQKNIYSLLNECEENKLYIPYANVSEYSSKEFDITSINKFEDLKLKIKTLNSFHANKPCLNIYLDDERLDEHPQIGYISNKELNCFNAWICVVNNYNLWIKFEGDYKTFYNDNITINKANNITVVLLFEFLASTSEALEISSKVRTLLQSKNKS